MSEPAARGAETPAQELTLPQLFRRAVERFGPDAVALREKRLGIWRDISWQEYGGQVERVGLALARLGLAPGDRVAILGENAPWWLYADLGTVTLGGVSVGIYTTSSPQQVSYILQHSGARFLFVEDGEQLDKWRQVRAETPEIEKVVVWDLTGLRGLDEPAVLPFDALLELGRESAEEDPDAWVRLGSAIEPGDLALLIYTSGTTGDPKGAMLTHANLAWQARTIAHLEPGMPVTPEDEVLSFLPLCHIFERLFTAFVPLEAGYTVSFAESPETVPGNLREVAPSLGYGVPRVWEKYHARILLRMEEASFVKRTLFRLALRVGRRRAAFHIAGRPLPLPLGLAWRLAHFAVCRKLKERLGLHRMRVAYSGAAPIAPEVLRFFHAIGLHLVEGYGQTEGSGVTSASTLTAFRPGTVGRPLPGAEVRIAEDGGILVRSPGVFAGYYRDEAATRAALEEGWLLSGDVGELDADGFLRIVDRKKDLIITAGGKNIAPAAIENRLKASPLIGDAIAIGEGRRFVSALIVLDEENVAQYAQERRIPFATYTDLATSDEVRKRIAQEVEAANAELARVEQVRKFTILPQRLYEEEGEVTPTLKVKRRVVHEKYSDLIERMYGA
jgi:long-chain acyl-CoA synthetase